MRRKWEEVENDCKRLGEEEEGREEERQRESGEEKKGGVKSGHDKGVEREKRSIKGEKESDSGRKSKRPRIKGGNAEGQDKQTKKSYQNQ